MGLELDATAYAFDATTIDLCLSLFPWAKFRKHKGAIKLHTLLEIHSAIPVFIAITAGNVHEVNLLDELILEPGSFIIMDRGFLDFQRLYRLQTELAFFVIRTKSNLRFRRRYSHPHDRATGVRYFFDISISYFSFCHCMQRPLVTQQSPFLRVLNIGWYNQHGFLHQ